MATLYCNACGAAMSAADPACPSCHRPAVAVLPGIAAGSQPHVADERVRRHIGTLSIFYYIVALLNGIAVIVLFIVSRFLTHEIQVNGPEPDDWIAPVVLRIVACGLLILVAGFFSIGWGLQHRRPWGRMAAIIAAFFLLFHLPFGTALGIYTLWVLLPNESERQYQQLAVPA